MVEIQHPRCFSNEKPGAINYVGLAIKNRLYDFRDFGWIVLKVCVLNDHNVAANFGEACLQSLCLSAVDQVLHQPDPGITGRHFLNNLGGAVPGTIVDYYDLEDRIEAKDLPDNVSDSG